MPNDAFGPTNIKSKAGISLIQLIGPRKEMGLFQAKNESVEEQLYSAEVHVSVENGNQRHQKQEFQFVLRANRLQKNDG